MIIFLCTMPFCKAMDAEEKKCIEFFNNSNLRNPAMQKLDPEDFTILASGTRYKENPKKFDGVYQNLTRLFFEEAKKNDVNVSWEERFLLQALIKSKIIRDNNEVIPTDETSAKQFIYNQLSPEKKATFFKDNYLKNSQATANTVKEMSEKLAELLAQIKIIEDTPEAKALKAAEFFKQKMIDFETLYKQ